MARSKDLAGEPLEIEAVDIPTDGERILRTGRREEDGKPDGWLALRSLAFLVGGTALLSYLIFSL